MLSKGVFWLYITSFEFFFKLQVDLGILRNAVRKLRAVCPVLFASIVYLFIIHLSLSQESKNNLNRSHGQILGQFEHQSKYIEGLGFGSVIKVLAMQA